MEKDVIEARALLKDAVAQARAEGFRVSWQMDADGDPFPVLNGGPEPKAVEAPAPAPAPVADDDDD